MPDFKRVNGNKVCMTDGPEVGEWLKFFEMGPDLTCLSTMITGDPSGGEMNLRVDHTHFFSGDGKVGGHYHTDLTPSHIKYVGYFCPATTISRVDNAYKYPPTKPKI